eukprot:1446674-Amphidinium_carterae.2
MEPVAVQNFWTNEDDLATLASHGFAAAEYMRSKAPLLCRAGVAEDFDECARWTTWADKIQLCSMPASALVGDVARLEKLKNMVAIVGFAGLLSQPNDFQVALQLALSMSLPSHLLKPCNSVLRAHMDKQHTSRTTCWRHRLTIYFALLLQRQEKWNENPMLQYEIVDSSPQGGFDYMMRLTTCIPESMLTRAYDLSVLLCVPAVLQLRPLQT